MTHPEDIKELIEKFTNLDLETKSRERKYVDARIIAYKLTRDLTNSTYNSIGNLYKKNHASIIHGVKKFDILKNQLDFKKYMEIYERCLSILLELKYEPTETKRVKFIYDKELTPIQRLVGDLTEEQEKELIELITIRKKSWEWKTQENNTKTYTSY